MQRTLLQTTLLFGLVPGCGRIGFDASSGDARFGDGALAASDANLCASLVDDFEDGVPAAIWTPFAAPGVSVVEAGTLSITLADLMTGYGGYDSACRRDLRTHTLVAEVISVPSPLASVETYISLSADTSNTFGLRVEAGGLVAYKFIAGTYMELAQVIYSPSMHRYWRLQGTGGTESWETSADAATWIVMHTEAIPIDLTSTRVRVAAGAFAAQPTPGTAVIEQVALTP